MTPITIDHAVQADIQQIRDVAYTSWHDTYAAIFKADFIDDFIERAYSDSVLQANLNDPAHTFLVARSAGAVVGYCHFGPGHEEMMELFRLYISPDHQRQGLGSRFLERMESRLRADGVPAYCCFVHAQNETGKAFYRKHGFIHDARHDDIHGFCEWYLVKRLV